MTVDGIGIKLDGGPAPMNGWSNVYESKALGGWPPPEEIMAFSVGGVVGLALPENVPADNQVEAQLYRKVSQSRLSDEAVANTDVIVRGARYQHVGAS